MNLNYLLIFSEILIVLGLIGILISSIVLIKILRKNQKENLEIIKSLKKELKNEEEQND